MVGQPITDVSFCLVVLKGLLTFHYDPELDKMCIYDFSCSTSNHVPLVFRTLSNTSKSLLGKPQGGLEGDLFNAVQCSSLTQK